jgi:hypothetical protein
MIKTYSPKPAELTHEWYIVDAEGKTLGRLATLVATYLLGKHKPQFSPSPRLRRQHRRHQRRQGRRHRQQARAKKYYRHSGYPGGIKETSLASLLSATPPGDREGRRRHAAQEPPARRPPAPPQSLRRRRAPARPQNPKPLGETK